LASNDPQYARSMAGRAIAVSVVPTLTPAAYALNPDAVESIR
jgi:hypothetical protein